MANLFATVPLSKAVNAAARDSHEDLASVEESYMHWAVRALRDINRNTLKLNLRRVAVSVNNNIARLPCDCKEVIFAGFLDSSGRKVPIETDGSIFGRYTDLTEDCCAVCGTAKGICEALEQTVKTRAIVNLPSSATSGYPYGGEVIGGDLTGEELIETTTTRFYPNGDYVVEKTFPVWDMVTETIAMETTREVVAVFQVTDCGCIAKTDANISIIKSCCPDAYNSYFAECCDERQPLAIKVNLEEGVIYFTKPVYISRLYLTILGDLPRKNGEYIIPEVALEAIVAWILERKIRNKKGVSGPDKDRALMHRDREIKAMRRSLGKLTINRIFEIATKPPRP